MDTYIQFASEALWWILMLSLPALAASVIVGLTASLLQALTQVQEQTLVFVPKLIATVLALMLSAGWMLTQLLSLTRKAFDLIPLVGRGM
ncbi:MAG: type III secretion system export apparatus subunit SctS [Pyrinomonadaceae bacterium]